MNEEFCFWSFTTWKTVLQEIGFQIRESSNNPAAGSRVYTNTWVRQNRYEGQVALTDVTGRPIDWPPTNMVLLAEKPSH